MKTHLRYDLSEASRGSNENRSAHLVMKELGIVYQYFIPQSICDQWWFFNCENIPDKLPAFIKPLGLTAHECIGHGLSKEDAIKIDGVETKE